MGLARLLYIMVLHQAGSKVWICSGELAYKAGSKVWICAGEIAYKAGNKVWIHPAVQIAIGEQQWVTGFHCM